MKEIEKKFKELLEQKHTELSCMWVQYFVTYCNERGVYPNGGAFLPEKDAQIIYI